MTILGGLFLVGCVAAIVAVLLVRRFSDGPVGPLPGGPLRRGELVTETRVDWSFAENAKLAQLQLVAPPRSRTTGILVHKGDLFIPCDLGFIWRRVQPPAKWLMAIVWKVKRWHEDVLRDGRVVLRVRGKRFERHATLVEDREIRAELLARIESEAEAFLSAPLSDAPADPDAILFFRLDARTR